MWSRLQREEMVGDREPIWVKSRLGALGAEIWALFQPWGSLLAYRALGGWPQLEVSGPRPDAPLGSHASPLFVCVNKQLTMLNLRHTISTVKDRIQTIWDIERCHFDICSMASHDKISRFMARSDLKDEV